MAWVVIVSHEETVPGPLNLRTELMKKVSGGSTNRATTLIWRLFWTRGYIRVSICNHHGSTLSFIISTKPLCFEVPCYISSPLPVSLTPALLCLFFRRGAARLVPRAGLTAVHGIYATIVFIYLRHVFIFISCTSLFAILP